MDACEESRRDASMSEKEGINTRDVELGGGCMRADADVRASHAAFSSSRLGECQRMGITGSENGWHYTV